MLKKISLAVASTLVAGSCFAAADTVVYGNFYTAEDAMPRAQAVAIKDGKFIYVGNKAGVKSQIDQNTKIITRKKNEFITPPWGDGHTHASVGMLMGRNFIQLTGAKDLEEYRNRIKDFIAKNPNKEIYLGTGWDNALFDSNGPTAAMLDDLSDKPIGIQSIDGHSSWLNSAAMKLCNINKETPDVPSGVISRDKEGNPTGTLRDAACLNETSIIKPMMPQYSLDEMKETILAYQNRAIETGELMYLDVAININGMDAFFDAYEALEKEGKLKTYIFGGFVLSPNGQGLKDLDRAIEVMNRTKGGSFQLTNVKIWVDGVVEGGTVALIEPYANNPEGKEGTYYGEYLWQEDELVDIISKANRAGLTMHFHTIGDGAVKRTLNAIERSQKETGLKDMRTALTHLQLVKPEDVKRMADLGVIAVTNPYWFKKAPNLYEKVEVNFLGKERAEKEYPMKTFFDAGIVVSIASDFPVTPYGTPAMEAIFHGVNRIAPDKDPKTLLGPKERVTVDQMLKAATINLAKQLKCEDQTGSIAVGKNADMVVFDKDITKVKPLNIMPANVTATYLKGELVYSKK